MTACEIGAHLQQLRALGLQLGLLLAQRGHVPLEARAHLVEAPLRRARSS